MKILSVELKHGTFEKEGKKYDFDNVLLWCEMVVEPEAVERNGCITEYVTGNHIECFKVKRSVLDGVPFEELYGRDVDFRYNRFGNIVEVLLESL